METRSLLSAAILCAALAGCQSPLIKPFGKGTKLDCDGTKSCTVAVSVTCPGDPQIHCDIAADPELIILRSSKGFDKITWELPKGDFTFPPSTDSSPGIDIDSTAFDCKEDGTLKYVCQSKRREFGVFKYTINLKGPRKVDPLDPWVVNN